MKQLRIHEAAAEELEAAEDWYNHERPGLGFELHDEVDYFLRRVLDGSSPGVAVPYYEGGASPAADDHGPLPLQHRVPPA